MREAHASDKNNVLNNNLAPAARESRNKREDKQSAVEVKEVPKMNEPLIELAPAPELPAPPQAVQNNNGNNNNNNNGNNNGNLSAPSNRAKRKKSKSKSPENVPRTNDITQSVLMKDAFDTL